MKLNGEGLLRCALGGALAAWACTNAHDVSPTSANGRAPQAVAQGSGVRALDDPPPSPAASPSPSPTPACPYGKGTLSAQCVRDVPTFGPEIEAAIDRLVQEHPELFDTTSAAGAGSYRVLDSDKYYAGIVQNLQAKGHCANFDFKEIQVKNNPEFSEQYDVLLSTGHIRRGDGAYRSTCRPSIFPVDAKDWIDSVRVAFYGIKCPDGRTPPRNGEGLLPVGCVGFLTATPKDRNNVDVDERIVGKEIAWTLPRGSQQILVEDDPRQAFNKVLTGVIEGEFTFCATVHGVQGCLNGEVIP